MRTACDVVIRHASEVVSCTKAASPKAGPESGSLTVIEDGCIAFKNDRIAFVGKDEDLRDSCTLANRTCVVDATEKVVLPGFVDAHTHLVFDGWRENEFTRRLQGESYQEIQQSGGGIYRTVERTRKASFESLMASSKKKLSIMLRHGTTTVEAKSGYGLSMADELKCLQVACALKEKNLPDVVSTFLGAHIVAPEYKENPEGYVDHVVSHMLPEVVKRRMAEFCDVFCDVGAFSRDQARRILLSAAELGLRLKIHADEFAETGGAQLAAELGAVSADHLLHTSSLSAEAMAKAGVIAVLLPATPFSASINRYADARMLIGKGVPIALGTDFSPLTVAESMQMVISLACVEMKMSPAEAIVAATINSAFAVGRGNSVGSLDLGKAADAIVFDVPNHRHLGYRYGTNLVSCVVKGGEVVFDAT